VIGLVGIVELTVVIEIVCCVERVDMVEIVVTVVETADAVEVLVCEEHATVIRIETTVTPMTKWQQIDRNAFVFIPNFLLIFGNQFISSENAKCLIKNYILRYS
jgi:hypothetical protein